jgi:hypothetical protein
MVTCAWQCGLSVLQLSARFVRLPFLGVPEHDRRETLRLVALAQFVQHFAIAMTITTSIAKAYCCCENKFHNLAEGAGQIQATGSGRGDANRGAPDSASFLPRHWLILGSPPGGLVCAFERPITAIGLDDERRPRSALPRFASAQTTLQELLAYFPLLVPPASSVRTPRTELGLRDDESGRILPSSRIMSERFRWVRASGTTLHDAPMTDRQAGRLCSRSGAGRG